MAEQRRLLHVQLPCKLTGRSLLAHTVGRRIARSSSLGSQSRDWWRAAERSWEFSHGDDLVGFCSVSRPGGLAGWDTCSEVLHCQFFEPRSEGDEVAL